MLSSNAARSTMGCGVVKANSVPSHENGAASSKGLTGITAPHPPDGEPDKPLSDAEQKRLSAVRLQTKLMRRLSLADVENAEDIKDEEIERGMLLQLENHHVMDLANTDNTWANSRKWSIGSDTDKELHRRPSFSDKSIQAYGSPVQIAELGIGYACKKGLKPVSPNQDSFFVMRVETHWSVYGVFDGHGRKGHDISNFVKEFLPKLLLMDTEGLKEDPCKTLRSAFLGTQRMLIELTRTRKLDASSSGTTSSVILHNHKDNVLYIAHVGDSRCVIASSHADKQGVVATDLMQDHKPELPIERARIEKNGGEVRKNPYDVTARVYVAKERYPGLAMSRALGDLIGYNYAGVSAEPETSIRCLNLGNADMLASQPKEVQLNGVVPGPPLNVPEGESGASAAQGIENDKFILLCSDGVWEFMSSQEAVAIAARLPPRKAMQAAEEIARISWDRWIQEEGGRVVDDITAVLIYIGDPTNVVNVLSNK